MKTYSAKPAEVVRSWYVIDASEVPLGRLATVAARHLTGKTKPMYTTHIDCGDNVVVINAAKVGITGNKLADKKYYHHSGYPGGIKEVSLEQLLQRRPQQVVELAVKGMLPKNRLQADRLKRLKVYAGAEHPHSPQNPQTIGVTHG